MMAGGKPYQRRVESIPCPACGGESRITGVTGDGCSRVYRQCYDCDQNFKTSRKDGPEIIVEDEAGLTWEQTNAFWQLHWAILQMPLGPGRAKFKRALDQVQQKLGIDSRHLSRADDT